MIWGTRFDMWIIFVFHTVVLILFLISSNGRLKTIVFWYVLIVNGVLTLFNLIDIEYFKFTLKRSTFDLFNLIFTGSDVWILLPQFIIDFWYIILLWLGFLWLLWVVTKKILSFHSISIHNNAFKYGFILMLNIIIIAGIAFIVIRGTRLRPVNLLSASLYSNSNLVPVVLNTPFSIIKTWGKSHHLVHTFFKNKEELKFDPLYFVKSNFKKDYQRKNVVVIILESFSKEHIGFFDRNKISFTPFLDSLLQKSLVIRYSFANGRKSIESLPSIFASIPSLMETPYILSSFSSNEIEALPHILKKNGYTTSFYHGGTNGTMGFDVFSTMAGIERYFGRWQYPNQSDYDGNWGIWDEPYLQYVVSQLNKEKQPFFSVIYTLSSHHPYNVPDKYKNVLPKGEHEILQSIAYTDLSIRQFFENAKKSPWFKNTLFVITADHVFGSHSEYYYRKLGSYSVPIAFYCETDTTLKGVKHIIAQHCDIAPSILDYLGISTSMICFGSSIWDSSATRFAINYINGSYLFVYDKYAMEFDGEKMTGLYDITTDSLMYNNLLHTPIEQREFMLSLLKSVIQQYDDAIINNRLTVKRR
ncbi:MAG: sulfatase-like hydrolase/transferase [Bacteroidales bacterium]|nr:sulfatase-like hydrolase/transferase [Bacteroidales bacterium]